MIFDTAKIDRGTTFFRFLQPGEVFIKVRDERTELIFPEGYYMKTNKGGALQLSTGRLYYGRYIEDNTLVKKQDSYLWEKKI